MQKQNDILNKATNALKNEPTPTGPPQDLIDSVAANLTSAEPPKTIISKRRSTKNLMRIAAALILVAAGVGIAVFNYFSQQDVVLSIWFDKLVWNSDEVPSFKADLIHRGRHKLTRSGGYQLQYDRSWYVHPDPEQPGSAGQDTGSSKLMPRVFQPDAAYRDMDFALDERWRSRETGTALKLTPGRHKIRLALNVNVGDEAGGTPARIISDPARFRILEPGQTETEQDWLEIAAGGQPAEKYTQEQVAAIHLNKYGTRLSHEELAKFYYQKAFELSQRGGDPLELADVAEYALAFDQDDVELLRLHIILGDAYHRQTKKYTPELWGAQRRIAAMAYLAGLDYALQLDLPAERPERTSVFKYRDGDKELTGENLTRVAIAVARDPDRIRELVEHRRILTLQIISMYAAPPDASDELRRLATEYIADESATEQLVAAAEARRTNRRSPIPAISVARRRQTAPAETLIAAQVHETNDITVEAGFIPDKTQIILGEPAFISFYVKNIGDKPYSFFVGGDIRGSVRHNNFRITAVDAVGNAVKDPYSYDNRGGRGGDINLKPGQMYCERLYLGHWCAFEKPGFYTVTCKRTLNEHRRPSDSPQIPVVVNFKLAIAPYDKQKMMEVIDEFGNGILLGDNPKEASLALSAIDDDATIPYLASAMQSRADWQVKNPAIDGLAKFATKDSVDALILGLKDPDYVVSRHAAKALAAMKETAYVIEVLTEQLADERRSVRALAAKALGETRSEQAFEPLLAVLNDQSPDVQSAAAQALGTLGDPRCIEVLMRYTEHEDFGLRLAAVKGLVAMNQPLQAKWLTPIIKATTDINDQKFHDAIRILRLYGKEQAAPALVGCLQFDDPSPRNAYNMFLIQAIEASPGGPKYFYKFHHDPNTDGTSQQIQENQKILQALKSWLQSHQKNASTKDPDTATAGTHQ